MFTQTCSFNECLCVHAVHETASETIVAHEINVDIIIIISIITIINITVDVKRSYR